ncbi:hypothetical protein ILUMI_22832 [Ignelater luminosus]|uniref:Major facilitator superfamily (MFS) profile domain-containing protein n=1 Tax=Ignelater luminosus TaxID=2038154 RepID=A0A8K0CGC3_IGNLU|nr:hypothetical protein ILUMI_22832 [Ignelater luminosus]
MDRSLWEILTARYIFAVLGCLAMAIIYGLKVNLSIAMVRMINQTATSSSLAPGYLSRAGLTFNNTDDRTWRQTLDVIKNEECSESPDNNNEKEDGPFLWSGTIQGILLSSYFWGYLVAQLPGGRIAELVSAKWVMYFAVAINIACTLLSPLAAKVHYGALLVLRIAEGIGGGVTFPAMHVMLAQWAPPTERSIMSSIAYAGTALGTVIFTLVTGVIAAKLGWEAIFYIEGAVSACWLILWPFLVADSPRKHKFISQDEQEYLTNALSSSREEHDSEKKPSVPWKSVIKSRPFFAILVAHTCSNWGWYMVLIELPLYMKGILKFKIAANGVLTAMPYFSMWIFSIILSKVLDTLQSYEKITTTTARKTATLIACITPAICFLIIGYIGCQRIIAIILMSTAITSIGGMFCGFLSNHIDIAPNFAGTLMAITNMVATIPGIVVPIFVGKLTQADPSITSWRIIFWERNKHGIRIAKC